MFVVFQKVHTLVSDTWGGERNSLPPSAKVCGEIPVFQNMLFTSVRKRYQSVSRGGRGGGGP